MPKPPPSLNPRDPVKGFARGLRRLRLEAGQPSLTALARAMSCSHSTVSAYLNGYRLPPFGQLRTFVEACGGDPEEWKGKLQSTWEQIEDQRALTGTGIFAAAAGIDPTEALVIETQTVEGRASATPESSLQIPLEEPGKARDGSIVTFYSYEGAAERTMALANIAWILASNGLRVLTTDWNLQAPALDQYFRLFIKASILDEKPGVIDMIRDYEWAASGVAGEPQKMQETIAERSRLERFTIPVNWKFPAGGVLDFLSPGRQNRDYVATLSSLDWDHFYDMLGGAEFMDKLRAAMKLHYDYVLIDSPGGLSDIADICTLVLPDILVDCFTLSTHGIAGAARVARLIGDQHAYRGIRILPVPVRVDHAEMLKAEAAHELTAQLFSDLPVGLPEMQQQNYWAAVALPYRAFYAYEETLAIFGDAPGAPASMLSSLERVTAHITNGAVTSLPPMDEQLRLKTRQLFARKPLSGSSG